MSVLYSGPALTDSGSLWFLWSVVSQYLVPVFSNWMANKAKSDKTLLLRGSPSGRRPVKINKIEW
jgi:hypothetical protein